MRPVQFDDETVIQAAKDLEAAGRSVTGFAIRQKVGGGNPTRLKQVWDEYRNSSSVVATEPATELPGEVADELETFKVENVKRLDAIAAGLNSRAVKAAQLMVNDVLKSAGEQRQQADRELQDAAQTVDDLEKQLDTSETKIVDLSKDLDLSQATAQANAVEIARLNERLVASVQLAAEFTELKKTTAAAGQVHQSAMTAMEAELAKVRGEREALVKDLASAQAKSAADHQASIESSKRAERVEAELAQARTTASMAREEAAKLAGKVEALEQQIDKLKPAPSEEPVTKKSPK